VTAAKFIRHTAECGRFEDFGASRADKSQDRSVEQRFPLGVPLQLLARQPPQMA
jgi:hypothetical protein